MSNCNSTDGSQQDPSIKSVSDAGSSVVLDNNVVKQQQRECDLRDPIKLATRRARPVLTNITGAYPQ